MTKLETMTPAADAVPDPSDVAVLASLGDDVTFHVWGGDWCQDCTATLPGFAAALDAAGIDVASVYQYPVTKREDGSKRGPGVEAYEIEYIPTIVVERDGRELARFVEDERVPPATYLADKLSSIAHVQ